MCDNKVKPIIAITMGDPSGVGPEIVVETMISQEIHQWCKPFVIGSIEILKKAAGIRNIKIQYNKISQPDEAKFEINKIDVLETGDYDVNSLEWGKEQKLAGRMAVDFIIKSIELGLEKKIDGVATAPIHKGSIKLGGITQAGHTEIYQEKTNSPYALTMFSCHKLKVFFLSRHMSVIEACKYVTKENLLNSIIQIHKELKKVGLKNPLIAVAALNPHSGDNGLFGKEEIDEIIPAVKSGQEMGINVVGPCPADSVFHIGKAGKYDAILSLYHDQGHIACKTLDFEKSVTLTFGLPFIRGSVDHGTAFDIAGQGVAKAVSLIEATKIVAEYASSMTII